jgi:hypothetical protein
MYRTERLNNVVEDNGLPLQSFMIIEALRVYEFHLLQDGGFSRLSGT